MTEYVVLIVADADRWLGDGVEVRRVVKTEDRET